MGKNKAQREYYQRNKEKSKIKVKKWRASNPEMVKIIAKRYRLNNLEKCNANNKKWRQEHPERMRFLWERWVLNNPEKYKLIVKKTCDKKRGTPQGKIENNISRRISASLHNGSKDKKHWETLVGYTAKELKKHLEKLFMPEMTWGNYGNSWVIDHKIPLSAFNYENPDDIDFKKCWSLSNLQPMSKIKNRKKWYFLEHPFQPALLLGGDL